MARLLGLIALLVGIVTSAAGALEPRAVNPKDTDAVAFGKLFLMGSPNRACLNLTLLEDDPASPTDGDAYCVYDPPRQQCCFHRGGDNFCADFVATP